ncbi:MAG: acyltransferase [Bacteroidetes bacterium]|nr:acyltransferase [Bacteroidota bacterium]
MDSKSNDTPLASVSPDRVHYLDSWRGIAAVVVVLFHLITPLSGAYHLSDSYGFYSRLAFDGTDWVSFFFVLSGFALSYSFIISRKTLDVLDFYIKRVFRIYPLYILAVLLSYIICRPAGGSSGIDLLREILLFPRFVKLLIPGWSLSVEVGCSLLMPLVIVYALHSRKSFVLILFSSLFQYTIIGRQPEESPASFLFHFMLGTYIALLLRECRFSKGKMPMADASPAIVFLILLMSYPFFCMRWYIEAIPDIGYIVKLATDSINMSFHQLFHFISGTLSFVIIVLTLSNSRIQKILSVAPLQFLGKISFGIYIMHYPIIRFFVPRLVLALDQSFPIPLSLLIIQVCILLLTIIASHITFIAIEQPFIKLGQKVIALPQYNTFKSRLYNEVRSV